MIKINPPVNFVDSPLVKGATTKIKIGKILLCL
jgi:hypothetical protein